MTAAGTADPLAAAARGHLAAWPELARPDQPAPPLVRQGQGHINDTFLVGGPGGPRWVLQRLAPIFGAELHHDIAALTAHLAAAGLDTPRLVPTAAGQLWLDDTLGRAWRLLTWVPGQTVTSVERPQRARAAGRLLGRFHAALWDLRYQYRHRRPGIHDTARHLAALRAALAEHRAHRAYDQVAPLAARILAAAAQGPLAETLAALPGLPARHVHGDPKISNLVFDEAGHALCLIDLDTLGAMPLPLELGDALRSWCNGRAEDDPGAAVDPALLAAALDGYRAGSADLPSAAERALFVPAAALIAVELAARFCADALAEAYFGWDRTRYASASEHNLRRAAAQLNLARSFLALA